MHYIGLDVGTSSCKTSVMDETGKVLASSSREYPLVFPAFGFVELDPEIVWQAVTKVLSDVSEKAAGAKAIAVSSLGETMVILNEYDRPVTNGIVYLDQRCKYEIFEIIKKIDKKELFDITLLPLTQMFSLSKILWYQKNQPEILKKGHKFFLVSDYISYKLSGSRAIDPGAASRTMFFDAKNLRWSEKIADRFDIPIDKFSNVTREGTDIGTIIPEVARKIGLPSDLRVLAGTHDQIAASIGSGAITTGYTVLGEGTSEGINIIVDKGKISSSFFGHGIGFEPYLEPEKYLLSTGQSSHGICVSWFMNLFKANYAAMNNKNKSDYELADELCVKSSDGVFFLPYLSQTSATQSGNNAPGCFIGLGLSTDQNVLYRAVLEGLSFETRALIETVEQYGIKLTSVVATGGGSKSNMLMQIKSDILNKPIHTLRNKESGINGLCMICSVACGDYASYEESVENNVNVVSTFTPEQNLDATYEKYLQIRKAVTDLYEESVKTRR